MQLAIVFASSALGEEFDQVVPLLRELVPSLKSIVGCSVRISMSCGRTNGMNAIIFFYAMVL